jgi:polyisoprenoid-binding protein YceI
MRVDGTSTLHDWTVKGPTITGHLEFKVTVPSDATTQQVREAIIANPQAEVDVEIPVNSLKSGKNDMDKKMYGAMKLQKYPTIHYTLTTLQMPEGASAQAESYDVKTVGELTVAGATRTLDMPMTLRVLDARTVQITGTTSMRMTDFNIKPPEAMLGMIKSGDRIQVKFQWTATRHDTDSAVAGR